MEDLPQNKNETETGAYITLTADLVSAFVSNNSVPMSELGNLLTSVHATLSGLAAGGSTAPVNDGVEKPTSAQIRKSITHEALISFEDSKPYKTLKRHLTLRGLSPEAYRAKYGLPADYPMTCASYSEQRSKLAHALGLGQQRKGRAKVAAPDETISEESPGTKKKPGRPRKAAED